MLNQTRSTKWLLRLHILWLIALMVPWIMAVVAVKPYWHPNDIIRFLVASLVLNVLAILLFGYYLGTIRNIKHVWLAMLSSTVVLAFCYDLLMITTQSDGSSSDIAAGAAIATFILPAAAAIGVLLLLGYGLRYVPKQRVLTSAPAIIVIQSLTALLIILFIEKPGHWNWIYAAGICLTYGIVSAIAIKKYIAKYAQSLGLSNSQQLIALASAVKTTEVPMDKDIQSALPAYLDRRVKFMERQRKALPLSAVFLGGMILLSLIVHAWLGLVIFGFFTLLTVYTFYSFKKSEYKIAALRSVLDKRDITIRSEAEEKNQHWEHSMARVKKASWVLSAVLFLLITFTIIALSYTKNSAIQQSHSFTSTDDNFTISFPGRPSTTTYMAKSDSGADLFPSMAYVSAIDNNTQKFGVFVEPWPDNTTDFASLSQTDLKSFITDSLNRYSRAFGAKIVATKEEHLFSGNTLAEEATTTRQAAGHSITGYFRILTIRNAVYVIWAQGSRKSTFEHFADSYKFIGDPATGGPDYSVPPKDTNTGTSDYSACDSSAKAAGDQCDRNVLQSAGQ